jgi:LacI family transcriptional regulator
LKPSRNAVRFFCEDFQLSVSIEDVAKKAEVSISTVSRVINRRNIVNVKTRERVESAIEELGYRPNVFARGLMLKRSNILALVLPDLHGEFYSEIIRGANLSARDLGYELIISSFLPHEEGDTVLSVVTGHSLVDGVTVMISEVDAKTRDELARVTIPLVVMDGDVEGVKHDNVVIDQRQGAIAIFRHLIYKRHAKRIVFVGGLPTNIDTIERLAAFRDIMQEANLSIFDKEVFHLDYSYQSAFELGAKKVCEWAKSRASVFAANDEMAAAIIDAAIESGISVPDQLPVVGFDDTRIARMTRPRLTTVRVPMSTMGASAVELLCQRLDDPDRPPTKLTLQSELIVRESCGSV